MFYHVFQLDKNPLTTTGCMDLIDAISSNQQSALINLSLRVRITSTSIYLIYLFNYV